MSPGWNTYPYSEHRSISLRFSNDARRHIRFALKNTKRDMRFLNRFDVSRSPAGFLRVCTLELIESAYINVSSMCISPFGNGFIKYEGFCILLTKLYAFSGMQPGSARRLNWLRLYITLLPFSGSRWADPVRNETQEGGGRFVQEVCEAEGGGGEKNSGRNSSNYYLVCIRVKDVLLCFMFVSEEQYCNNFLLFMLFVMRRVCYVQLKLVCKLRPWHDF